MNEKEIIEQLKSLQAINPDPEFVKSLKQTILLYPRKRTVIFGLPNILSQSLNFGFSMALMAIFIVFVLGGINGSLKNQVLTKALGVEILNENAALSQHIESQIDEAHSLTSVAEKTNLALKEASTNGPAHINPVILEKEASSLNFSDPTDNNIDDLLDKAI